MTYSDKLKDPRWQKKRLEILQRDEWMCQWCQETEETLHVHHLKYEKGKEPWDVNDEFLLTVCENCHRSEHEYRESAEKQLLDELKKYNHSTVTDVMILIHSIETLTPYPFDVSFNIIERSINNSDLQKNIFDNFFISIKNAQTKKEEINE